MFVYELYNAYISSHMYPLKWQYSELQSRTFTSLQGSFYTTSYY